MSRDTTSRGGEGCPEHFQGWVLKGFTEDGGSGVESGFGDRHLLNACCGPPAAASFQAVVDGV